MTYPFQQTALAALLLCTGMAAQAFTFQNEDGSVTGNFDYTVSAGTGVRASKQGCGLVIGGVAGTPVGGGCADALSGLNDQGDLNYNRGDRFTTYLKGTHELLLNMPDEWKFMGRVSWLRDFSATDATGNISAVGSDSFPGSTASELRQKVRLLDLWVSKAFTIGEQNARVRVGNQVVNWGESLFLPGGINQTNAMDFLRLSQPGTQLKEAILPTPMVNFSTGLGKGLSLETYVQAGWQSDYFPPVSSYWSTAVVGPGATAMGVPTPRHPSNGGQYGVALRYAPQGSEINYGAYFMNYHDKAPVLSVTGGGPSYSYLSDRKMYGLSANFPLGNWAIGAELSYRPKDAVSLNSSVGSASAPGGACLDNGHCYVETGKYQLGLTGLLSLTPSDNGEILHLLGADTATLMAEAVVIRYPGLKHDYNGIPVAAGLWGWGYATVDEAAATLASGGGAAGAGSPTSWGYNFDFSWVYDGTVIPGWQLVPEVYFFQAVNGRTPNAMATFMQGAKMANFTVSFIQNPATWQVAVNYAKFWGGDTQLDQPLRDRSFYGITVSRNF